MSFFEQQEQRKNKQFISLFDSVYFISEHGSGSLKQALKLLTSSFLRKQTYLLLVTPYSVKAVYVCSSYEHPTCEPYITFEDLYFELKACIDHNSIGEDNLIYGLGFAKKRFIEQLLNLGMQLDEQIIFNTESPDITDADYTSEGDEWAFYQGLPKEYDSLRIENKKLKTQYQELFNKKGQPEALYKIQEKLYESTRQELDECRDKLDKSLLEVKSLHAHSTYFEKSLNDFKRKAESAQQMAGKKILNLEQQLEQAKTDLANISIDDSEQLNARTEKSYQTTIGLLLELMISPKGFDSKKPFPSQSFIISEIVEQSIYGQGKSTLESRFSNANDVLSDVKKK